MKQWYTIHTKPLQERLVAQQFEAHCVKAFLPEIRDQSSEKCPKYTPFFPCYLFILADLSQLPSSILQWMPGLRRVVTYGDISVPLPDELITLIKTKLQQLNSQQQRPAAPFQPGDTVRITSGSFKDMKAIFEGPTTPSKRVQVLLEALGQHTRLRINIANLEKDDSISPINEPKRSRRTRGRGRRIRQ